MNRKGILQESGRGFQVHVSIVFKPVLISDLIQKSIFKFKTVHIWL